MRSSSVQPVQRGQMKRLLWTAHPPHNTKRLDFDEDANATHPLPDLNKVVGGREKLFIQAMLEPNWQQAKSLTERILASI